MSTRSASNKRTQAQLNGEAVGYVRKSAGSAKPARPAAASVRVVPASSKAQRAARERGENLSGLSKEEKRARKQEIRAQEDRVYAAGQELLKEHELYGGRRRVFWTLLGAGIVAMIVMFILMSTAKDPASMSAAQMVVVVVAYACVIGAFVYDLVRIRPIRNECRAVAEGMSDKKLTEFLERKMAENRAEASKKRSKKK